MRKTLMKLIACIVLAAFVPTSAVPPSFAQSVTALPAPGQMVGLSPAFAPALLRGIKVDPRDPFKFVFVLDPGDSGLQGDALAQESARLIRYFLASVTTPEKDFWVNLSPYEQGRIIPEAFGMTEMGRDLLSQDYILKQVTASLMYPEGEAGGAFWKEVYARAYETYGTTDIPFDTFNKVWITPDKAEVYEAGGTAFVGESHLKVMLESDYLVATGSAGDNPPADQGTSEMTKQAIREMMLPLIEKEVNEGRNFTRLRQVYQSLILAVWYKKRLKDSMLSRVYADRNKVAGVDIEDREEAAKIWAQYVEAFRKGAYSYIKDEVDHYTQEMIPRKYFSGGVDAVHVYDVVNFQPLAQETTKNIVDEGPSLLAVEVNVVPEGPGLSAQDSGVDKAALTGAVTGAISSLFSRRKPALGQPFLQGSPVEEQYRIGVQEINEYSREYSWNGLKPGTRDFISTVGVTEDLRDMVKEVDIGVVGVFDRLIPRFMDMFSDKKDAIKDYAPGFMRMLKIAGPNERGRLVENIQARMKDALDKKAWATLVDFITENGPAGVEFINRRALILTNIDKGGKEKISVSELFGGVPRQQIGYLLRGAPIEQGSLLGDVLKEPAFIQALNRSPAADMARPDAFLRLVFAAGLDPAYARDVMAVLAEPFILEHPDQVSAGLLEEMARWAKDSPESRYALYFAANYVKVPEEPRRLARELLAEKDLFPQHRAVREYLKAGPKEVLMIHNMRDGRGDEMIRLEMLIQSLVEYNPEVKITLATNYPGVHDQGRITSIPLAQAVDMIDAWAGRQYDAIVNYFDYELSFSNDLQNKLNASGLKQSAPIFIEGKNHALTRGFVVNNFQVNGREMAQERGLTQGRGNNMYGKVLGELAELGLPLTTLNERADPQGHREDNITGRENPAARALWEQKVKEMGEDASPVILLNPYGGQDETKGFSRAAGDQEELARLVEGLVIKGNKVVLLPNGEAWGTKDIADAFISTLPADVQKRVVVGFDPSVDGGFFKYFARFADHVVTVEGGMMHMAFHMAKPFDVILRPGAGREEWFPPGEKGHVHIAVDDLLAKLDVGGVGAKNDLGGIDLDPARMNMSIRGDGSAAVNAFDPAMFEQLQAARGFMPVILNIAPVSDLPAFFGLSFSSEGEPAAASS